MLRGTRPAWHRLGQNFATDAKVSATEAVRRVGDGIEVVSFPIAYQTPGLEGTHRWEIIGDHKAIVRKPTVEDTSARFFGITREAWHQRSYADLARYLDPVAEKYPVESAGVLKEGRLLFLVMKGEPFDVKGDQVIEYVQVNLSQCPGVAHLAMETPVRTVCANTNAMAEGSATIRLSIPHSSTSDVQIKAAADLIAALRDAKQRSEELFNAMAGRQITENELDVIFKTAWPDPAKPTLLKLKEQATLAGDEDGLARIFGGNLDKLVKAEEQFTQAQDRQQQLRQTGKARFEAFDPSNLRGTVWAGYNAVTEVADWREGRQADLSAFTGSRYQEKVRGFRASAKLLEATS
jgi:phage/plasmid-like protein (TIGR03299 family)